MDSLVPQGHGAENGRRDYCRCTLQGAESSTKRCSFILKYIGKAQLAVEGAAAEINANKNQLSLNQPNESKHPPYNNAQWVPHVSA